MTTPTVDPNPPYSGPDTTGTTGVGTGAPTTSQNVSNKDTEGITGAYGTDGNLNGPDSSRTVNAPQTSGTDGTTASGAVVSTAYAGTPVTTQSGGAPGSVSQSAYRAPVEQPPVDNRDTTLTNRRTDVPDDNDPLAIPSGYVVNQRDTTGVGGGTGPVTFTPPGAPTAVTATAVPGHRTVLVSWTPGSDPVGAPVKRWIVQGNTTGSKIVGANETQTEMDDGLVGGQAYRFTVYAETNLGSGYRSAPSNSVTVSNDPIVNDNDYTEDNREPIYRPDGTSVLPPAEA